MGKKATFYLIHMIIVFITIVMAALAIICNFASGIDPLRSGVFTFFSLAIIPLLIINFLFFLFWAIKFRIWFIIPLVAIAANYPYLSSVFRFTSSSEVTNSGLKVATYNVHNFKAYKLKFTVNEIARLFKDENVDVICIQEFAQGRDYNLDSIKTAFASFSYHAAPVSTDGSMDMVVFSKYPILSSELHDYDYTENSFMSVNLDVNGREVLLINAHLQTTSVSQSGQELATVMNAKLSYETKNAISVLKERLYNNYNKRAEQVEDIVKIIEASEVPIILCGDFNDLPSSYAYHKILSTGLKDGFKSAGAGYECTFKPYFKLLRIDYIFHSETLSGVDYYSLDVDMSDHKPVIMEIII